MDIPYNVLMDKWKSHLARPSPQEGSGLKQFVSSIQVRVFPSDNATSQCLSYLSYYFVLFCMSRKQIMAEETLSIGQASTRNFLHSYSNSTHSLQ